MCSVMLVLPSEQSAGNARAGTLVLASCAVTRCHSVDHWDKGFCWVPPAAVSCLTSTAKSHNLDHARWGYLIFCGRGGPESQ